MTPEEIEALIAWIDNMKFGDAGLRLKLAEFRDALTAFAALTRAAEDFLLNGRTCACGCGMLSHEEVAATRPR